MCEKTSYPSGKDIVFSAFSQMEKDLDRKNIIEQLLRTGKNSA